MARFRCRGVLANKQSVIVKVTADDVYQAATEARKELIADGGDLRLIKELHIRPMDAAKSQVYWGKVPATGVKSNRGAHLRKPVAETAATAAEAEVNKAFPMPDGSQPEASQPVATEPTTPRRNRR